MLRSSLLHDPRPDAAATTAEASAAAPSPHRGQAGGLKRWTRWLHVYTSMIALLVVLFFGVTGVTLNHPEWTFGLEPTVSAFEGGLPDGWVSEDGEVEFLVVSEYVRETHQVGGEITDFGNDSTSGHIAYAGPGYKAGLVFSVPGGAYNLTVEEQGVIAVLNDLHKGRDTASSWSWVIDASGALLVVISLTGLLIQLLMRKRRATALVAVGAGALAAVAFTLASIG